MNEYIARELPGEQFDSKFSRPLKDYLIKEQPLTIIKVAVAEVQTAAIMPMTR